MIEYNRPQLGSKLVIRFENCTHRGPLRVSSVDRADPLTGTNISAWVYNYDNFQPGFRDEKRLGQVLARNS